LHLWRGHVLADAAGCDFADAAAARLTELRSSVLADRIEADLALGEGASRQWSLGVVRVRWAGRRPRVHRGLAGGAVAAGGGDARCMPCPGPAGRHAGRAVRFSWKIGPLRRIRVIIGHQNFQVSRIFHDLFRQL
jgi:hypothetical protein